MQSGRRTSILQPVLWALYAGLWIWLAIAPVDRQTWILENVLVLLFGLLAWLLRHRFSLSRAAAVGLWTFLVLHAVGAHFTYSEVPYQTAVQTFLGFDGERNHYDRVVHFAAGLLLTQMVFELLAQAFRPSVLGARVFAVCVAMAASLVYELIEWAAAVVFGGDAGAKYLGTQGDTWDAQKDMALASLGACLAMLASAVYARIDSRPSG
jgi:putative membrane protein